MPIKRSLLSANAIRQALVLLVLLAGLTILSLPAGAERRKPGILILHSYNAGYKWTDDIHRGIMDMLQPSLLDIDLYVEYLDMKRYSSEARFPTLSSSLSAKYRGMTIDYVLATDDAAFLFLQTYLDRLFPAATVLFCGTNLVEESDLGDRRFYGIAERADIEANFALMLAIHPTTKNIFIVNDRTITGRKVARTIAAARESYRDRVSFTDLGDLPFPEILRRIAALPANSLIFYTFFFEDSEGRTLAYDEGISRIAEVARQPIYGAWDFNLGFGMVGGMLTSGYHQGEAVGRLLNSFLAREAAPPRLSQSPNRYMFDYLALQRFGIPLDKLPGSAIIINRPQSFVDKHQDVLLFSAIFIALLILVIAFLIVNIQQRKRVERKLQQSELNFRGIFENAIEGLFQASLDGRFLKVNQSLAKILKCGTPEEVIDYYGGRKENLYVNRERHGHLIAQVLDKGKAQLELELRCCDGSTITALVYCRNVVDKRGRHIYLEGSMTDLTEYKKTQEIIIQTEKMLTLGGLSAGIAHEIKNPLTSMIQAANIIAHRLMHDSERNRQCAEEAGVDLEAVMQYLRSREIPHLFANIMDAGNRANTIVNDMLSFSKKTIGEFAFEPLEDIVREAVELAKKDYSLRRGYNFATIRIDYDVEENTPALYCSRSKILQVLFNLLKNSAEAMAEAKTAEPRITCTIRHDQEWITLAIADNGPGMEEKVREKIFEPFYSTKGSAKGTGLGLSIASYIVSENHKGQMSVQSAPGQGATFILTFPRRDRAAQGPPA